MEMEVSESHGTTATMALNSGVSVRNVDIGVLQKNLLKQRLVLPD
jgi:hypothetical protein